MEENMIRLMISPEISADLESPSVVSSSVPVAAAVDDDELKQIDRFYGEVLEKPWPCGNNSSGNANIEQEVSRYQICNRVTILQGDKNDPDYIRYRERCDMPEHLLFDILLRLPVISLLRLKSICKSWCSLIDSSTFITQHFDHNRGKDNLIALHCSYDARKFCLLSGSKYEVYRNLEYEPQWDPVERLTIQNSCNGIVCLVNKFTGNAALWNPAMKQMRPLPESSDFPQCLLLHNQSEMVFGFGFDVKSNDYKVVKFHFNVGRNMDGGWFNIMHGGLVEVYSLKTDSWKIIQDVLPVNSIYPRHTPCKNGKCLWIGYVDDYSILLLYFDLNDETFETMSLPGENIFPDYNALDFLDDKLIYIKGVGFDPCEVDHVYFEIWMLDEYGLKKTWNKLCKLGPTCNPYFGARFPQAFSKNGEFLLHGNHAFGGELYLYNFVTREDGYVENKIQEPNPSIISYHQYNESLVSVKRVDGAY